MKKHLEFKDGSSQKFWEISVDGNNHTVTYGKIGTQGTQKTKTFDSEEAALKDANKLIASKEKKGYKAVSAPSRPVKTYSLNDKVNPEYAYKFISYEYEDDPEILELLNSFIKQENSDEVEEIIIGMWEEGYDKSSKHILDFLVEHKDRFSNVKHFYIGDIESEENEISWIQQSDFEDFLKAYSHIETLRIKGGNGLTMGNFDLPNLKLLTIQSGGLDDELIQNIANSKNSLTSLEYLEIWFGTSDYGATVTKETVQKLLADKPFPSLQHLGLMNSEIQDDIVLALENHEILDRIKVLDISMGVLKKEGGESLLRNEKLDQLDRLNCDFHYMTEEQTDSLRKRFGSKGSFEYSDYYEDAIEDEWYYVEVGE
ncbi:WGR domain-containing protein [Tenacibaculum sp. M341]|uniref:WGR domain-containing protein n=1 Tax=Tenacibaculum sp. M341 TaxID=2530339 RepID=UPI00104F88B0|nr:WGR domain-containing protein [Tenacibaculum sp. M341]TCI93619.1 WGR domain-containing protein [Tenacibaculum sp. M341]